jgi:hypothetical protein
MVFEKFVQTNPLDAAPRFSDNPHPSSYCRPMQARNNPLPG